jgi:pSer/pThr/pTyr-binding forkhead associated (FHA) protein
MTPITTCDKIERALSKSAPFDPESTVAGQVAIVGGVVRGGKLPMLEQVRGPGAPRRIALAVAETVVGRGHQANLTIESALLSRRHVVFRRNGPELSLADLDSANGVFVNGVKAHSAVLHEGDTIQIGDVVFVLHEAAE